MPPVWRLHLIDITLRTSAYLADSKWVAFGDSGENIMKLFVALGAAVAAAASPALAQDASAPAAMSAPQTITLPINTLVQVTPANEITSKEMKEGTKREFLVVNDVEYKGVVLIPRGSPVEALVTWRTGKGIVGKSAKFELSFDWVRVNQANYKLRGVHRQEGRGNTAGALLGAAFITGKSATMVPGQIVNVFTAEPIMTTKYR